MEASISYAITKIMMLNKTLTLEFLQKALVDENPLNIYGTMYKVFCSSDFKSKEDKVFVLGDEHHKLVFLTVLKDLNHILDSNSIEEQIVESFTIDFLVLIRQHFYSFNYGLELNSIWLDRVSYLAAQMPETAFNAYRKVLLTKPMTASLVNFFLEAVCEEMKVMNPVVFSNYSHLLEVKDFTSGPLDWLLSSKLPQSKLITFLYQSLRNPVGLDELHLYMAAICGVSVKLLGGKGAIETEYHALFVYDLLIRISASYGETIILKLTGYNASFALEELNQMILDFLTGNDLEATLRFCVRYCLLETINFINQAGKIENPLPALEYAIFSQKNEAAFYFLTTEFPGAFDCLKIMTILQLSAEHSPRSTFYIAFDLYLKSMKTFDIDFIYSLILDTIKGKKFDNFDFLWDKLESQPKLINKFRKDEATHTKLIIDAMECKLPEDRIVQYLDRFLPSLPLENCQNCLIASAANGHLELVNRFTKNGAADQKCLENALRAAANNHHPKTTNYLIKMLLNSKAKFSQLAKVLVICHAQDGLKYIIDKHFE